MKRPSLALLLGLVLVVALGFAAIREATELWAQAVYTLTLGALLVAALAALVERGRDGGWTGAALFGWVYFLIVFGPGSEGTSRHLLTNAVLEVLVYQIHGPPVQFSPTGRGGAGAGAGPAASAPPTYFLGAPFRTQNNPIGHGQIIGHCIVALLLAMLGRWLGRLFARRRDDVEAARERTGDAPQGVVHR